jgi:Cof subfamily protein (haloacid dehalogenase superfamily)
MEEFPLDIKVLAIDLDGTLLNKQNAVTPENIEAIRLAKEKGIEVVPCTGRLLCESRFAIEAIGGCNYSMHCNGSIIFDHRAGKPIYLSAFPKDLARRAVRHLEKHNVLYQVYVDDASCCPKRFYQNFTDEIFNAVYVEMFRDTQLWMEDVEAEIEQNNFKSIKYYIPNRDHDLLERIKEEMIALPGFDSTYSSYYSLEVFQAGMDKRNGLSKLLEHLGCGFENLMMIGDSENDLRAIQAAAIGIAMDNALDFIKAEADFVTLDRNNSGVAHAIRKFLL